jgi:hypothetical protein
MHPRSTRNRPLLLLKRQYRLFPNNICSPGFLRPSLFKTETPSTCPLYIDAVSCHCNFGEKQVHGGIRFQTFLVSLWLQAAVDPGPMLSVTIHAPFHWQPNFLLEVFEEDLRSHEVVSLLNSYYANGKEIHFNTINTIHHQFR